MEIDRVHRATIPLRSTVMSYTRAHGEPHGGEVKLSGKNTCFLSSLPLIRQNVAIASQILHREQKVSIILLRVTTILYLLVPVTLEMWMTLDQISQVFILRA